jgi:hypothetical protein
MKRCIFYVLLYAIIAITQCEDNPEPNAIIRMESPEGSGNYVRINFIDRSEYETIGEIEFLALSRKVSFVGLSEQEIKGYDKNNADWYLDGNFTETEVTGYRYHKRTAYKDFYLTLGMFHYLVRAKKAYMMGIFEIKGSENTVVVYGWREMWPDGPLLPPSVNIVQP